MGEKNEDCPPPLGTEVLEFKELPWLSRMILYLHNIIRLGPIDFHVQSQTSTFYAVIIMYKKQACRIITGNQHVTYDKFLYVCGLDTLA